MCISFKTIFETDPVSILYFNVKYPDFKLGSESSFYSLVYACIKLKDVLESHLHFSWALANSYRQKYIRLAYINRHTN